MIRLIVVAVASIGLILFVAFFVSRLLRTRTRGMSIRMQVFLALAVIVGAFAFGLGLMVIDRIEARAVWVARQAAADEAQAIAGIMSGELDRTGKSIEAIGDVLEHERNRGADLRMELFHPDGRLLFPAHGVSAEVEEGAVAVEAPIIVAGEKRGAVRIVRPTVVMRNLLADIAPTVLVISLVLGAAAGLAAAWIGRAIAAPIEALSAFSERVSAGERTAVPPVPFGREVTHLTLAIDSMRRELEGRPFVETFASDLSHELKNPVAAIRASAEILEDSALDEPEKARQFVRRIREAAERIERLLNELLSLARIEARGAEAFEPIDLGVLVRRVLDANPDALALVQLEAHGDLRVKGDPVWLGRAVSNLINNAIVHAAPPGQVRTLLQRDAQSVQLIVVSNGTISRHVRRRLFRRFVTTRSDRGGTGLGLAIVRAVAEAHGGQVELVDAGPPEVAFRLTLPSAFRGAADRLRDALVAPRTESNESEKSA